MARYDRAAGAVLKEIFGKTSREEIKTVTSGLKNFMPKEMQQDAGAIRSFLNKSQSNINAENPRQLMDSLFRNKTAMQDSVDYAKNNPMRRVMGDNKVLPSATGRRSDLIAESNENMHVAKESLAYNKSKAEYAGLSHGQYKTAVTDNPSLSGLSADELKAHVSDVGVKNINAAPKSSQRKIFEKKLGISKGKEHQIDSTQKQFDSDMLAIKDQSGRAEIGKKYNIEGHEKMTESQMAGSLMSHHAKKLESGPSTMDHIIGNKYHINPAGGLITASVVGSLFSSRGQQSNAQLYNQTPGPGQ